MWFTSLMFGVFVMVTFTEILIYSMAVPFFKLGNRTNITIGAAIDEKTDKKLLNWVEQILGKRPTTTTTSPVQSDVCPHCKCGLTTMQHRIVNGVKTKKNKYPWMAQLIESGKFICGASVINSRYVVTAAHCLNNIDKNQIVVRIGDHDRTSISESKNQDFKVHNLIRHGGFSMNNLDNDIAIIKLKGGINFGGLIRPVCLAEKGLAYSGKKAIVIGWGATDELGPTSNTLLEATVPIMTNSECRSTNYHSSRITANMMCAGYAEGGKDSCRGDSGGPLHVINQSDKVYRLVGIVSWGEGCGIPNLPGVYTRVNRYLTWLKRNTADACYCD